ncbi:MAG: circadian clock protein KaiC [Herminiimonas sp.]|nr:circadian clock protein KaiC [Herminiimonas sp.]
MILSSKAPTGISGFDEITGGGLPRGRTTLLVGGPGSGKTIFALQFLVHGAKGCREPGIFIAFEETAERIVANAESFGWNLKTLRRKKLFLVDAQPSADLVQSGTFDICGMLAALAAQAREMGAKRIVFDALDIVMALLPDAATRRREIYRLHEWLLANELTAVITSKAGGDDATTMGGLESFGFMQFMVDCAVILSHGVVTGVSQRNLRVQKYRGSSFDENESPFLIGASGIEVALARTLGRLNVRLTNERVSSGVKRLDTMLGGGYYRGASVLITGSPGTAKTTLSGAFAEAACLRGERTLFVSFDSDYTEVVRNLASVGIRLERFLKNGCLRMVSARTITGSAETYLVRIKSLAAEHKTRCLVIDPISTWSTSVNDVAANNVTERLTDWSKSEDITLVCTRLFDEMFGQLERSPGSTSPMEISTLADTWIHLNYLVQAGERNRGLSIIKSRGTAHSNQVRELILSDAGVTLSDTYTAGGEVLMGTLRYEKESAERVAKEVAEVAAKPKRVRLDAEEAELEVRVKSLQTELVAKQVEKALLLRTTEGHERELSRGRSRMRELRGADAAKPEPK